VEAVRYVSLILLELLSKCNQTGKPAAEQKTRRWFRDRSNISAAVTAAVTAATAMTNATAMTTATAMTIAMTAATASQRFQIIGISHCCDSENQDDHAQN
jgi:hypothetical protein